MVTIKSGKKVRFIVKLAHFGTCIIRVGRDIQRRRRAYQIRPTAPSPKEDASTTQVSGVMIGQDLTINKMHVSSCRFYILVDIYCTCI